MVVEDIESLLLFDTNSLEINDISDDLLGKLDSFILQNQNQIVSEVFNIYKKFVSMKQNAPEGMKNELFSAMRNFIKEKFSKNELVDALFLSRFLIVKSKLIASDYSIAAEIFTKLGNNDLGIDFIRLYEKHETNLPLKYLTLGNFYNLFVNDYKMAIKYYEAYLKIDETKSVIYTILGSLYAKAFGDFSLKDQIYYFEKAYKLKPKDRLVLHSLAFGYEKLGNRQKTDKFYRELLAANPTDIDYYNYGGFLISCGDFKNGHKYFTHRFNIDDTNLKYPLESDIQHKWDLASDISQKTLLVYYEQGFGDTFMYCRFVPKLAKKVIFVVQDNLVELLKFSEIFKNIEIISEKNFENVEYDVHMALMDTPLVFGVDINTIPYTEGYLTVPDKFVSQYAEKYIQSDGKLKIGISYHGNKEANYNGRDIDFGKFSQIFNIENVQFYSFSLEKENDKRVIYLGETFKSFTDTACALKNMDMVISTDNVILNLAGTMGIKTYGLFNKYPNFRWFKLEGDNVGWYKSVIPLQAEENNYWSDVFDKLTCYLSCGEKNLK